MGYIYCQSDDVLTLELVIKELSKSFPGTKATGEYFENRIALEEELASKVGMPLDAAPIESTRDAARRLGPQPCFIIPLSDSLSLSGRLKESFFSLSAERDFTNSEVQPLVDCLETMGLKVSVCGGDARVPFEDALENFKSFLVSQGWSSDLLWLTRERVTGHKRTVWIFRPEELESCSPSREFYREILKSKSSIRIDALGKVGQRTLAYVHNWGANSRMLNFGVPTEETRLVLVGSRVWWWVVKTWSYVLGHPPFLKFFDITPAFSQSC
ncbi:hypothetical protein HG15A2_45890 [Adhaeretor mobilis]|uniref:Uncharacterized protein n=1 Tax=Adhaeretor mobilis TaxID=1930276 RepID=A0A517N285_9BACT|nr:hypothetical protein HG15A2_45890 [Adhaeretor mobilis]